VKEDTVLYKNATQVAKPSGRSRRVYPFWVGDYNERVYDNKRILWGFPKVPVMDSKDRPENLTRV
jgi:hypothetical protein